MGENIHYTLENTENRERVRKRKATQVDSSQEQILFLVEVRGEQERTVTNSRSTVRNAVAHLLSL